MARGWESKSVEAQIELAESRRSLKQAVVVNAKEAERIKKRESLLLSRTRVVHDLQSANNPRYREILQAALKHLDEKLAEIK
jgi:hypothetical protein